MASATSRRPGSQASSSVGRIGRRGCGRTDPFDRRVEIPERLPGHDGGDLGADAEGDDGFVGNQQPARPRHRRQDGVHVERRHRAQIDHFDRDALPGHGLRRGEALVDHARDRHDGDVGAGAHNGRPADRNEVIGRRLWALHAVEESVLDEHHRVGILDGGPQQAVGVGRRRRHDDGEARDVGEQRLEALGVLAARRAAGAELGAHGQRHLGGAAGHERQLRRLVEQLVEADAEEVDVHELDHRAHSGHRRAHAEPHDGRLGDRRVAHPVAEPVAQAAGEAEDVAALADVDAGHEHAVVGLELRFERRADGVHSPEHRRIALGRSRLDDRRPSPEDELAERGSVRCRETTSRLDRFVELAGHGRLEGLDLVVSHADLAQPLLVEHDRIVLPPGAAPPRPTGTARDRPRSDRANGRWRPPRAPARSRHAPRPRLRPWPRPWPPRRCRRRAT